MIISTKALVIKEYSVGESDKYITLFSKELGRIQVLAPHAKKTGKGFASGTQLFVYGDFMLASHKDTYRLLQVEIIEMFHHLREDLIALSYASYISEFAHMVTQPALPQPDLLQLVLLTLRALVKGKLSAPLVRRIFEMRALVILGFGPQLLSCSDCGEVIPRNEGDKYFISVRAGGLICYSCKSYEVIEIGYSTLYTLDYICLVQLKKLFGFTVSDQVQQELNRVADSFVNYYIDKPFKTLDFIKQIEV